VADKGYAQIPQQSKNQGLSEVRPMIFRAPQGGFQSTALKDNPEPPPIVKTLCVFLYQ